jgi:hypothetical protein
MRCCRVVSHLASQRVFETRRVVTRGVAVEKNLVLFPGLGLCAERGSKEALSLGLVSEETVVGSGRLAARIPLRFDSRALVLPPGVARGAFAAAAHFVRGMSLVLVLSLAAAAVATSVNHLAIVGLAMMVLLLLAATIVHEVGHVVAYRLRFGVAASAIAVVRGVDCRLTRARGSPGDDLVVAVAGPLAPTVLAVASWVAWGTAPFAVLMFTLIALGHTLSLLLPIGDGATVREIISRLETQRAPRSDFGARTTAAPGE